MMQYIEVTGKTENEAIASALAQLGRERDEVSVEILERAKSGFLGIGSTPAKVRVSYDDGRPEPKPEKKAEPKPEKKATPQPEKKPEPKPAVEPMLFCPEVLQKKEQQPDSAAPAGRERRRERGERPARAPRADRADKAERAERTEAPAAPVDRGEECTDEKAAQIRAFLTGLLAQMNSTAAVKIYCDEKDRYKVYLEGEGLGALIGRRGETLDAIQQLTGYAVNHGASGRVRVQIDAENYREKREESLERLANKVAAKVVKYRRNVTLEPMNAYERHVIHSALQNTKNVTTFSVGTDPNRRVIVSYDRNKV